MAFVRSSIFVVALLVVTAPVRCAEVLTTDSCRNKNLASELADSELADCIEKDLYDPCDDASGSATLVNCYVGHTEVAKRRIERATAAITKSAEGSKVEWRGSVRKDGREQPPRNYLVYANNLWSDYVWEQCLLVNALDDKYEGFENLVQCELRLYRQRAEELEQILSKLRR